MAAADASTGAVGHADVAVVAIGRNEGERLKRCLQSVAGQVTIIVYVDSGSTDGSVAFARAIGARVVELDMTRRFTAARARNEGFQSLGASRSGIRYVQFVDGDCEVEPGWIALARDFLEASPHVAAVFGRRRERFPEASIYNRLCDEEWDVPPGYVTACGGDVMMRAAAFEEVGGYNPGIIAGEEPELCVRLRQRGWKLMSNAKPMTVHDAAMTHLAQWWRRAVRSGHAFAEGAHLHGAPPERHWVRETRRALLWGAGLPATIAAATVVLGPAGLIAAAIYPVQVARLYLQRQRSSRSALSSSFFLTLAKFPEAIGVLKFHMNNMFGRKSEIIEYK